MEDARIVDLYWQRDETAIKVTDEKYGKYLTKIAYNILSDREDSKECVNDTYFKAWDSMPPNKPDYLSLYLGKITRCLSIDKLRKRTSAKRNAGQYNLSLSELDECLSGGNVTEDAVDKKLLAAAIGKYLLTVSADARNSFIHRYYYMDSIKDIASYFLMSESKVKTLLFRTRLGLKEYLEKEGYM